ncbi:biotin carboxylase [Endozoicomonas elysicola]|uniref:Biotin carboxylase n=1 Tax=Endozoicomonas elysicola TaxID=305900 RepID=A0A081K8F3_9GAMM|nr:biotin carboxylase [Endozoicomonas elysicola]
MLIANRGEIALRVLKALQSLSIPSVAIYHHIDRKSPVVQMADEAVEIFGGSPSGAHLDIEQIITICEQRGVDAVHPCYGFLSENAGFARALEERGIQFIGPSPEVIELMGDKITSRDFVARQGVPVPPSITLAAGDPGFMQAVTDLGFPLVVKASAGGGGKGMSIVNTREELESTLRVARSEAEKYFGDDRVYVERYFPSARHIEVQVLGDSQQVIHLGERECSIQRRFQKIIEESPSPVFAGAAGNKQRESICQAAVAIARAAHYTSAGTVEFLYTPEGEYFFLEMNTRIQVEHPVTEMVYGVDLVAEQIRVAAGHSISVNQNNLTPSGHAIECRLCAEDAFNRFMPATGKVLHLKAPSGEGVRFDSGLYQGQDITTAFDPMLAKLVIHASSREEAITRMIKALRELVLLGIDTNNEYLIRILEHPAFSSGEFDTAFVERYVGDLVASIPDRDQLDALLTAALLSDRKVQILEKATPQPYGAIGYWRN